RRNKLFIVSKTKSCSRQSSSTKEVHNSTRSWYVRIPTRTRRTSNEVARTSRCYKQTSIETSN
ncbi:hypothetical protein TVAGG3_1031140, partial [Trichomonas vaginalis G3]|uniref:hypothetical protein n=1 Tax=Trichomonas vaginalis (strain ATCC PRA-98 / G3) TaxID=412133 RepID=UPI0021E5951F